MAEVPLYEADAVLIVAIAHHSRRPGYWAGRLGSLDARDG